MTHDERLWPGGVHCKSWVEDPDSAAIAAELNRRKRPTCNHDRTGCYLRCGVALDVVSGRWMVIPQDERLAWRRSVFGGETSMK